MVVKVNLAFGIFFPSFLQKKEIDKCAEREREGKKIGKGRQKIALRLYIGRIILIKRNYMPTKCSQSYQDKQQVFTYGRLDGIEGHII